MAEEKPSFNAVKEDHPLLILKLPGNLTGDLWHFATAVALYGHVKVPVIQATPISAVAVLEYTWLVNEEARAKARALTDPTAKKDALAKSGAYVVSHYLKRGVVSYDYLRSIGLPSLLVRLAQLTATNNPDEEAYKKVAGEHAIHLLEVMEALPTAPWFEVYFKTNDTPFQFKPEEMPHYPTADAGVKSIAANYAAKPMAAPFGLEDIIRKFNHKPPMILNNNMKGRDGPFVATAITMMYLADPKTRAERTTLLQTVLAGDRTGEWWKQARELQHKLQGIFKQSGKRILLFNYRLGDVNRQHDANMSLFHQVATLSEKHGMICVPIFVATNDAEAADVKKLCGDAWIDLYLRDVAYDKRYTAAFWTLVSTEMSKEVFGIVGGRSGSMDIASFMGVNCCEWDEPLCDPTLARAYPDAGYVTQNIDQCLRLFNQIHNVSIIYLDPASRVSFEVGHGKYEKMMEINKKTNCYERLLEDGLIQWLGRPFDITAKTIFPTFPKVTTSTGREIVDISKYRAPYAFRNLVTATFEKLENEPAQIRAVALREMGFEPALLLVEDPAAKPLSAKPDADTLALLQKKKAEEKAAKAAAKKQAEDAALQALREQAAADTPSPTSTLPQSDAVLTAPEALVIQLGADEGEDAGDVSNVDRFLTKQKK